MKVMIGLRREDKNIWERRVAITPEHARSLQQQHDIQFCIQPFSNRAFADEEFLRLGVKSSEDLKECHVILGIKEVPEHHFLAEKIYLFFSHTIKGQSYNMNMLRKMIDLKCTLIDYECIKDEMGRRVVFFGGFAGMAGMIESLRALGLRLKHRGLETPFADLRSAYDYHDVAAAKEHIREIGSRLLQNGLPAQLCPMIFGFSGYGHVSQGAQEMFDLLPNQKIDPEELESTAKSTKGLLYKVIFEEKHLVEPIDQALPFNKLDYFQHPEKYRSAFQKYLPYLHVLINGIYWDGRYPRLVTKDYLYQRYSAGQPLPLEIIGDISCDIHGSIECTEKATPPDNPFFTYHPITGEVTDGCIGRGIVIMAVDNLPAELPRDASQFFSDSLQSFIPAIAFADWRKPFNELVLPSEIKKAIILYNGQLTPDYSHLTNYLPKH